MQHLRKEKKKINTAFSVNYIQVSGPNDHERL